MASLSRFAATLVNCYTYLYMVKSHAAPQQTPPSLRGGGSSPANFDTSRQTGNFIAMALTMSWQLAIVVLVPVIGGVELDKALDTSFVCTFIGLGIALIGSGAVMWRSMQAANKLPVPKLTDAQKRAVKKSYEEDDD